MYPSIVTATVLICVDRVLGEQNHYKLILCKESAPHLGKVKEEIWCDVELQNLSRGLVQRNQGIWELSAGSKRGTGVSLAISCFPKNEEEKGLGCQPAG